MRIPISLFFLFLCVVVQPLAGQNRFVHFKTTDGLSFNNVTHLTEDDEGYIYASTDHGLNIFNGTTFTIFNQSNTEGFSNRVSRVLPLKEGFVLIGTTNSGLFVYDKFREKIIPLESSSKGKKIVPPILSLEKDPQGFLWAGTSNGELFCTSMENLFESLTQNRSIEWHKTLQLNGGIDALCAIEDVMFAGDESSGIYRVRRVGTEFISDRPVEVPGSSKTYALARYKGDLWIGTHSGLYRLDSIGSLGYNKTLTLKEPWQLKDNIVRTLSAGSDVVWAGTEGNGLFKFGLNGRRNIDEHFVYSPDKRHGLNSNYILSMLIDSHQNLWLGTWFGGINVMPLNQSAYYFVYNAQNENDIFSNIIWRIEKGAHNTWWLGTQGNGVCRYKGGEKNFQSVLKSEMTSVSSLYQCENKNRLYVGTWGNGVKVFSLSHRRPMPLITQNFQALTGERIYAITPDNNERLWIGSFQKGLFLYDEKKEQLQKVPLPDEGSKPADIRCILHDSIENRLWVGSLQQGLFRVQLTQLGKVESVKHYKTFASSDRTISVESIFLDSKGNLWLMLRDGLAVIPPGYDYPQTQPQLKGVVTTGMAEDSAGNLWVSSYKGIHKFSGALQNPVSFLSEYVFYDIAFDNSQDLILAASDNGLLEMIPELELNGKGSMDVIFSKLRVFDQTIRPGSLIRGKEIINKKLNYCDTIVLPHFAHTFSIEVNALAFLGTQKNNIHFQLAGFDKIWNIQQAAPAIATYTNVPPGTYTFKVSVTNEADGKSSGIRELTIVKQKPWWATNLALVVYALLFAAVVYAVYIMLKSRIVLKQELKFEKLRLEREHELHQQKLHFFTNISHDVRTPLTLMLGPLEEMKDSDNLPEKFRNKVARMLKNAKMLHNLFNQVLDFRKMETDNLSLSLQKINLNKFVKYTHTQFNDLALSKKIDFELLCPEQDIFIVSDPQKLESILFNLLSNAIKFTQPYGQILLEIDADADQITMKVKDTGIGIPETELSTVFTRFYRTRGKKVTEGTGIGLALVKKYVELLGGQITAKSNPGKGTEFSIVWPASNDVETFDRYDPDEETGKLPAPESTLGAKDLSETGHFEKLVVIDDNTDILEHLKEILETHYKVLTANNGEDGLALISRKNPVLVICDIMMEGMDGIEVTRKIKTNLATSHIPVILLTARNTMDTRIEGYEKGADAYIEKPFDKRLLLTRIKSLIHHRQQLKKKFMVLDSPTENVTPTSLDEVFLKKVIGKIEANITDSDFSVQSLVEEMQMTQDQLYRKIKALTGLSINHFIRSVRLKKAAHLLREERFNVSEVMFQVGFNNPSYFTRCFKAEFGLNPSEYWQAKE